MILVFRNQTFDQSGTLLSETLIEVDPDTNSITFTVDGGQPESRQMTVEERALYVPSPTDAERIEAVEIRTGSVASWQPGETVVVGEHRAYQGRVYGCIQAHTTQSDWTPDVTPAMWGDQGAAVPAPTEWVDKLRDLRPDVGPDVQALIDVLTGDD